MLALRGGAELVALWAQVASVIELVTGVAAAGVGTGLAVYVARTRRTERQHDFLREALRIGLGVGAPLAAVAGALRALNAEALSGGGLRPAMAKRAPGKCGSTRCANQSTAWTLGA